MPSGSLALVKWGLALISLYLREVKDYFLRENFRKLSQFLNRDQTILLGNWRFYELTFTKTYSNFKYVHGLNFTPKDVIQTSLTGAGTITWKYASFNGTNVIMDIGGTVSETNPTVVRFLLGRFS